jgi:uncharacterized protein with ParB-like and HNH nuclease domain
VNFLTDKNGEDFSTGANDIDIERDWVWESDNAKLLFSDWHVGEPNNKHNEDCNKSNQNTTAISRWHILFTLSIQVLRKSKWQNC